MTAESRLNGVNDAAKSKLSGGNDTHEGSIVYCYVNSFLCFTDKDMNMDSDTDKDSDIWHGHRLRHVFV
jgi:hypothetical protein